MPYGKHLLPFLRRGLEVVETVIDNRRMAIILTDGDDAPEAVELQALMFRLRQLFAEELDGAPRNG